MDSLLSAVFSISIAEIEMGTQAKVMLLEITKSSYTH
jgi:hypothetical protein